MPDAVVDACCTINLFATGRVRPLLAATGLSWHVPDLVRGEAQFIRQPDPDDASRLISAPIDLQPLLDEGILHLCHAATDDELAWFVQLATTLDDGEALGLAIAKARGWGLATDDRKARRLAGELGVRVYTTLELVKLWSDAVQPGAAEVATVLRNIQSYARFVPHKTMPLYSWWVAAIGK